MTRWVLAWSFFPMAEEPYKLNAHSIPIQREILQERLEQSPYCFSTVTLENGLVEVTIPALRIYCWTRSARRAKRPYELIDGNHQSFYFWILENDINDSSMCFLPRQFSASEGDIFISLCNHLQKFAI